MVGTGRNGILSTGLELQSYIRYKFKNYCTFTLSINTRLRYMVRTGKTGFYHWSWLNTTLGTSSSIYCSLAWSVRDQISKHSAFDVWVKELMDVMPGHVPLIF